jgi:hypothetical protein
MLQVLHSRLTILHSIYFPAVGFSASVFALEYTFPLQIRSVNLNSKIILQRESNEYNLHVNDLHTKLELTRPLQIFSIASAKSIFDDKMMKIDFSGI